MSLFGGGGGDDGSAAIRAQEEERQRKIREGTNKVNEVFGGPISGTVQLPNPLYLPPAEQIRAALPGGSYSGIAGMVKRAFGHNPTNPGIGTVRTAPGQFDDAYYSTIGKAFLDYYMPQVDEQYTEAQRALKFGSPSVQSSAFGRKSGMLARDYERSKADVADRSLTAEGEARTNTENSRNQILNAVRSGAGAEEAANSATQAVKSLKAPPAYSQLGDLFARYLNTAAAATTADNAGYRATPLSLNTLFRRGGSGALSNVK